MTAAGRLLMVLGLAACWATGTASAGTLIEFPNDPAYAPPARLFGYLTRPAGAGPFPAVVVLHGCAGLFSSSIGIADQLWLSGYVALAVDSFGPRGMTNQCNQLFLGQTSDAHAALAYLAKQPFVAADRVAVLGNSMGGSSALRAMQRGVAPQFEQKFRAGVAYYPACNEPISAMSAPSLILIGELDDWNLAENCRQMVARTDGYGAPVDLVVYPGAYHSFDVTLLRPGRRYLDHWLEYNEPAATDALEQVRRFLATNLGTAAEPKPEGQMR